MKNASKDGTRKSNGNRENPKDTKTGDAQHGQTDIDKAKKNQPPDATR